MNIKKGLWLALLLTLPAGARESDQSSAPQEVAQASDDGDPVAQRQMGMHYLQRRGEQQQALYWLGRAADQRDPEAQTALARLYMQGKIVARDSERAFTLFLQSARQRSRDGQLNTGALYLSGTGTRRDAEEAYAWFAVVLAGEHDNARAIKYQQLAVAKMNSKERKAAKRLAQEYIKKYAQPQGESIKGQ